jgi:very-short-patch-repair endonuclease
MKDYSKIDYWINKRGFNETEAQQKVKQFLERQRESGLIKSKDFNLTKDILENDYKILGSKYQVKLKYNVALKVITRWFKEFGIEETYYTNKNIDKVKMKELCLSGEPVIYAANQLNCSCKFYTGERNRFGWISKNRLFDFQTTQKLCNEIISSYSQGIDKAFLADPNLRYSIEYYTKNHFLESKKFTERVYRIIHNYTPEQIDKCVVTQEPLKFYTIIKGYGVSELKLCKRGRLHSQSGISQKIFNIIYKKLSKDLQKKCNFSSLNQEKQVRVTKKFKNIPHINKRIYSLDFCLNKHNIEFDGTYWHKDSKIEDKVRDKYLKGKGYKIFRISESKYTNNPEKIIEQCLQFLKD